MKLMKLFSVMLVFCMLPVTLTHAQSIGNVLKTFKAVNRLQKEANGESSKDKEKKNNDKKKDKEKKNNNDEKEDVSLTVSARARTKEEAVKMALNDAIRQTYGMFVSSNMEIADDVIVKDEIATISTGNIKRYEEVTSSILSDGDVYVTLNAVVSISNLVKYVKNKGDEVEFAGATLDMNRQMLLLNKENEKIALQHMRQLLEEMIPYLFDVEMKLTNWPHIGMGTVTLIYNENTKSFFDILYNTLMSLSVPDDEVFKYGKMGVKLHEIKINGDCIFYLRNDFDTNWLSNLWSNYIKNNIIISDNISSPTKLDYTLKGKIESDFTDRDAINKGTFLVQTVGYKLNRKINSTICTLILDLNIPAEDYSKYSNFKVCIKEP